ncbi:hypothetical protein ACMD2_11770 [Ananas comosus]|uniref:Uncharacterized protein n=1 Tax=Ananas comosus TaxID=4615 RepID=A0A199UP50_ANACO|nr:hypothetical protein ACMD2_11770 [Ananas comosus]
MAHDRGARQIRNAKYKLSISCVTCKFCSSFPPSAPNRFPLRARRQTRSAVAHNEVRSPNGTEQISEPKMPEYLCKHPGIKKIYKHVTQNQSCNPRR